MRPSRFAEFRTAQRSAFFFSRDFVFNEGISVR
jgi:hypothetical protein